MHFIQDLHVVKDNMFPVPPLFSLIHQESKTDYKEMYKVFNMGHRMEIYLPAEHAQAIIDISTVSHPAPLAPPCLALSAPVCSGRACSIAREERGGGRRRC